MYNLYYYFSFFLHARIKATLFHGEKIMHNNNNNTYQNGGPISWEEINEAALGQRNQDFINDMREALVRQRPTENEDERIPIIYPRQRGTLVDDGRL
jgi:hypothetical protein